MTDCVFCGIVARDHPAKIMFEDDHVLAFLAKDQVTPGHTLIIPKNHSIDIFDISPEDLEHVITSAQKVSKILAEEHGAEGINILHASKKAAQQSVFHFHLHIVPRHTDDGLDLWIKEGL